MLLPGLPHATYGTSDSDSQFKVGKTSFWNEGYCSLWQQILCALGNVAPQLKESIFMWGAKAPLTVFIHKEKYSGREKITISRYYNCILHSSLTRYLESTQSDKIEVTWHQFILLVWLSTLCISFTFFMCPELYFAFNLTVCVATWTNGLCLHQQTLGIF